MKRDYAEGKQIGGESKKIMFYVQGRAYFFGGIGHGPQIQRHARNLRLKGRVFAPIYRLTPQFPFP
ncbi:hypothetical protein BGZ57DRAFT_539358 [Hyaloscypha finlandica]|nr:hypothetical protein BGZ57DRAFT_539358 [Hyaloscypha finlandica]